VQWIQDLQAISDTFDTIVVARYILQDSTIQSCTLMQDITSCSQGTSQGSLADNKVLRSISQFSDTSVDLPGTVLKREVGGSGFNFSQSFAYKACLGDTRTAVVYRASNANGEFAIKVWLPSSVLGSASHTFAWIVWPLSIKIIQERIR
jgi:hypothetical protein